MDVQKLETAITEDTWDEDEVKWSKDLEMIKDDEIIGKLRIEEVYVNKICIKKELEYDNKTNMKNCKDEQLIREFCSEEIYIKSELEDVNEVVVENFDLICEDEDFKIRTEIQRGIDIDTTVLQESNCIQPIANNKCNLNHKCTNSIQCLNDESHTQTKEKLHPCKICSYKDIKEYITALFYKANNLSYPINKRYYECHTCQFRCAQKLQLLRHMRMHATEKWFKCNICNYKSPHLWNFERHIKGVHKTPSKCVEPTTIDPLPEDPLSTKTSYKCDTCSYESFFKTNLNRHMSTHGAKIIVSCHLCDFKCSKKYLVRHIKKVHSLEDPYACYKCSYKTASKFDLDEHMKLHTNQSGNSYVVTNIGQVPLTPNIVILI